MEIGPNSTRSFIVWAVIVFLLCSLFYLTNLYIHIDCTYGHHHLIPKWPPPIPPKRQQPQQEQQGLDMQCISSPRCVFFYKLLFSYVINFYLLNRYNTMTDITTKVATTMKMGPNSTRCIVWAIIVGEYFFFFCVF